MEKFPKVFDIVAVAALVLLASEMLGLGAYGLLTLPDQFLFQLRNPWQGRLVNSIGFPYATVASLLLALAVWLVRDLRRKPAPLHSASVKWRITDAD